jgi:putative heme-binding domain-containing protein
MALSGINKEVWWPYNSHKSEHVRMAVLLAARRNKDENIAVFLNDGKQHIVDEAITAINDLAITAARTKLAAILDRYIALKPDLYPQDSLTQWQHHRLINANYAQGTKQDAERLLKYAASPGLPTRLASEALSAIEAWNDINPIDTTTGLPTRANKNRDDIQAVITELLPQVLAQVQGAALVQSIRLSETNSIDIPNDVLLAAVKNTENTANIRVQALTYLNSRDIKNKQAILLTLTQDNDERVRADALRYLFKHDPEAGLATAKGFLQSNITADRQMAYKVLVNGNGAEIDAIALAAIKQLNETKQPDGTTLELIDFVRSRNTAEIVAELTQYTSYLAQANIKTQYASSMYGGNAQAGRNIFAGGGAMECMRCHKVNWKGGDVGPDLSDIGRIHDNAYLLESIVDVGAAISPGYGTIVVNLKNGETISGIYQGENENVIKLEREENLIEEVKLSDIDTMQRPMSGMPPMTHFLDAYQIRDLVAYLAGLKLEYEKVEDVH